jgi:AcrR family transcriptional regulator
VRPRVPPAVPADDKRAAILAAALVLFGRYGYRRTSIDDLAREAGIAKGTVYLYFDTKEAIFRGLCQSVMAHVLAGAETASREVAPVRQRLRRVLAAKFDYFHGLLHGSPHANELLDSSNRLSADLFRQSDRAYARLVARTITEATMRGELRAGRSRLTPSAAADLLIASAYGATSDAGQPAAPALLRRRLDALVSVVIAALGGADAA